MEEGEGDGGRERRGNEGRRVRDGGRRNEGRRGREREGWREGGLEYRTKRH